MTPSELGAATFGSLQPSAMAAITTAGTIGGGGLAGFPQLELLDVAVVFFGARATMHALQLRMSSSRRCPPGRLPDAAGAAAGVARSGRDRAAHRLVRASPGHMDASGSVSQQRARQKGNRGCDQ